MPNQTIICMQKSYPFGSCPMPNQENSEVIVRKKINTEKKQDMISKAKLLKKLKVPNSIHIISIFEDLQSIQIYYEYVPVKFEIWMKSVSDFLVDNLSKSLYILTTFLAENKVSTLIDYNNLGLDKNYHFKYFLDLEKTFFNQFQNPSTLKQKYYRQINLFIKSFNSDKIHNNPLFFSLNDIKIQPQGQAYPSMKSFPRNLQRTISFGSFEGDQINLFDQAQTNDKQPQNNSVKKQKVETTENTILNLNSKLRNIQQKLQKVKEKGHKVFFSSIELQKKSNINEISRIKTSNQNKLAKQNNVIREVSIDKLIAKEQKEEIFFRSKPKKCSQSEKDGSEEKSYFFRPSKAKIKSEKFKSQKSDSPVEYMDFVKSKSQYVQDFLNVLEDSSESERNVSFQQEKWETSELLALETDPKRIETRESQNSSQSEEQKWWIRFDTAIKNSKKLIDRMRSPPKPMRIS